MRKIAGWLLVSFSIVGCAPGVGDEELTAEADEAIVALNAISPNAISPNAISPNAISPNAISPNAISPNAISPNAMTALQDPGEAGELSRMHVRYAVSCALTPSQSFTFTWTDLQNEVHEEVYPGLLGLAPDWAERGLTETEQRWITACLGARTNYYSTTVLISARGGHSALATDQAERDSYSAREGAFWGNIYGTNPFMKACHHTANVANSRSRLRDCAAGHLDGGTTYPCGIIEITGDCDALVGDPAAPRCTAPAQGEDGFPSCEQVSEVITAFLPPP
jgi:hypothetical protein